MFFINNNQEIWELVVKEDKSGLEEFVNLGLQYWSEGNILS